MPLDPTATMRTRKSGVVIIVVLLCFSISFGVIHAQGEVKRTSVLADVCRLLRELISRQKTQFSATKFAFRSKIEVFYKNFLEEAGLFAATHQVLFTRTLIRVFALNLLVSDTSVLHSLPS